MNISFIVTRARKTWRELSASRFILVYGISQVVIMVTGLVRIRIMSVEMSASAIGTWLFWINILAWGGVLSAASGNSARMVALSPKSGTGGLFVPRRLFVPLASAGLVLSVVCLPMKWNLMFGSTGPVLLTLAAMMLLAPYFGYQQGLGLGSEQFIANATSSVIAFALSWIICATSWWATLPSSMQVYLMVGVSCLSMLGPYIWAWIRLREALDFTRFLRPDGTPPNVFFATAALLSPAFVSGFDSVALVLTRHSDALGSYGVLSRLTLLVTLVPSAIYVQVFNRMSNGRAREIRSVVKLSGLLLGANTPFVLAFVVLCKPLASYLSHGKITIDNAQIFGVLGIALVVPVWICISGALLADDELRIELGRSVVHLVIPSSIILTLVLAYFIAAPGPVFASIGVYALSCTIGYKLIVGDLRSRDELAASQRDSESQL